MSVPVETAEAVQRAVRTFGLMGYVKRAGDATGLSWSPLAAIGFGMPVAPLHLERAEAWLRSVAMLPAVDTDTDQAFLAPSPQAATDLGDES